MTNFHQQALDYLSDATSQPQIVAKVARLMERQAELENGHRLIASCINTIAASDKLPPCLKPELTLWSSTIAEIISLRTDTLASMDGKL